VAIHGEITTALINANALELATTNGWPACVNFGRLPLRVYGMEEDLLSILQRSQEIRNTPAWKMFTAMHPNLGIFGRGQIPPAKTVKNLRVG
jgi:hypothetical protein